MFWIIVLTIMYILSPSKEKDYKDYDCYDKLPYKCGNCKKNCKWKYIVKKFEESEKKSED